MRHRPVSSRAGHRRQLHWSVPDPAPSDTEQAFENAYTDLAARIDRLAPALNASTTRLTGPSGPVRPPAADRPGPRRGTPRRRTPVVLFLCAHNAGRSQMALGFFQHLAGDNAIAWSGGSEPGIEINPPPSPPWLNAASTSPTSTPSRGPTRSSAPRCRDHHVLRRRLPQSSPASATRNGSSTTRPASPSTPSAPSATRSNAASATSSTN
jgi:protein-tyrosine-phosphatase